MSIRGALTLTLRQSLYKNVTGIQTMYPLKVAEIERKLAKTIYINDENARFCVCTHLQLFNVEHHFIRVQILKKQLLNTEKQVQLMKKQYQKRDYRTSGVSTSQTTFTTTTTHSFIRRRIHTKIERHLSTLYYGRFTKKNHSTFTQKNLHFILNNPSLRMGFALTIL